MSGTDDTETAAEVLATLRASGWDDEDIAAVPGLAALAEGEAK